MLVRALLILVAICALAAVSASPPILPNASPTGVLPLAALAPPWRILHRFFLDKPATHIPPNHFYRIADTTHGIPDDNLNELRKGWATIGTAMFEFRQARDSPYDDGYEEAYTSKTYELDALTATDSTYGVPIHTMRSLKNIPVKEYKEQYSIISKYIFTKVESRILLAKNYLKFLQLLKDDNKNNLERLQRIQKLYDRLVLEIAFFQGCLKYARPALEKELEGFDETSLIEPFTPPLIPFVEIMQSSHDHALDGMGNVIANVNNNRGRKRKEDISCTNDRVGKKGKATMVDDPYSSVFVKPPIPDGSQRQNQGINFRDASRALPHYEEVLRAGTSQDASRDYASRDWPVLESFSLSAPPAYGSSSSSASRGSGNPSLGV